MTTVSTQLNAEKAKVINIKDTAEEIINQSINEARKKTSRFNQDKDLSILLHDKVFTDQFHYSLAENIAGEISKKDESIESVYLFDPSANPGLESGEYLPIDPCLHLLLVVDKISAGLDAFLAAYDRAITEAINKIPSPIYSEIQSFMDVILITNQDIESRKGYAALISSIYSPPLRVWAKE
jgi:hypothetical protein